MKYVLELVRWERCGKSAAEAFAEKLSFHNEFRALDAFSINDLFKLKGIPLKAIEGEEYYVYYKWQPSSAYRTTLYINDEGKIDYKVNRVSNFALSAFFSEVIVFTLTDKLI